MCRKADRLHACWWFGTTRRSREKEKVSAMKKAIQIVCVVVVVAALGSAAMAVNIETVRMGNVGNSPDHTGYGAVDYEYNIGKYEVTAGQYCEFLNGVAKTDTYGLYNQEMDIDSGLGFSRYGCNIKRSGSSGNYSYSVAADWANRPVNYVSWGDSARFANWLHNGQPTGAQDANSTEDGAYFLNGATSNVALQAVSRESDATWVIPSDDEWYKAAYYKGGGTNARYWDYPTSTDSKPGYIDDSGNFSRVGDGSFTEGGIDPGNYATYNGDYSHPYSIGSPYYRTEVGEHENSESPYGTFDQGGNIWEWTEAIAGSDRVIRGGGFGSAEYPMLAVSRSDTPPTNESFHFGFRVAQVPEPATLSLLTLGGLALVRRRKRRQAHVTEA